MMLNDCYYSTEGESNYTSSSASGYDVTTLHDIIELMKQIKDPWEDFAVENGFSFKNGDKLIVPLGYKDLFGDNVPDSVIESKLVNKLYFIRHIPEYNFWVEDRNDVG